MVTISHVNREKCIEMHTNWILKFKLALYSGALLMNLLTLVESCQNYYCEPKT